MVEEFARNGGEIEKEIGGSLRKERGKMGMEESGSMKTESGSKRHWKWRKMVNLVVLGFWILFLVTPSFKKKIKKSSVQQLYC